MASLLQKSTPWIEDSFVYACSFDASRSDEEGNGSDSDFNDNDEEMEPQTENTIPAGLHDDDDDIHDGNNGGRNKAPPSRGGKIVQIIDRGGDPNYYVNEQHQQKQWDGNNHIKDCCPPYLILHDGQYSTIAFLSEEAYNSSMMRQQDVASRGTKQPKAIPRKSLISISQYTISTIKCCAQHNNKDHHHQPKNDHNEDILPLQLVRPDMPRAHLSQVQMSLNTNLLLSLYLLGPITLIGAENQGLIGNTINVNCSIKVRRVLISHMAQFDRVHKEHTDVCVNIEEEEDYQHWTMVQRLEACHCYYQLLKERQGGTIPMWPWESRLVGGEMDDDGAKEENDSANDNVGIVDVTVKPAAATTAIAASPGRVERMIQKYENLEELLREDDNEEDEEDDDADVAEAAVGDKRAGRASTGTYLAKWDSEEEQVDEEEEEEVDDTADAIGDKRAARASTGTYLAKWDSEEEQVEEDEEEVDDTADAIGDKRAARASTGTYLAKWDSEEDQEEEEAEEETKGHAGEQVQQQHHEAEGGEGEENEKDTHAKNDDNPIEQGNVAELFDNFDDINDILDLEEDEPVIAREGEDSASANAILDSNEADDGIDIDNIESNTEQGEDNETAEENEEYSNTQDDNAATFVGIGQMFVESDEDDDDGEEEAEEEDEEEQAPLLTQQEFNVYQDEETEPVSDVLDPPQEVTESQIPLPPVKVSKQSTKLSREDGLTREYVESQIPLPPPNDTQSSDEDDGGDIGTESQIPVPSVRNQLNKQSADESASEDEKDDGDIGTESQIPFQSRRKPHAQSLDASDSEDEESDGDIGVESQIPFPPRIKQHTESLDRHTDDEEGTYPAESQVPIPQKQSTKTACSPRKPIADASNIRQSVRPKRKEIMYDSDDDWMRIRKVKPTTKPTKRAPRVQSQIAGEGSEENFPTNVLDTSQICGNNENEAEEEEEEDNTGISEKEMQQPISISTVQKGPSSSVASARSHQPAAALSNTRTTDHRVRFAIDDTDQKEHSQALPAAVAAPALPPPPVINQRELFISVSNKASKILFQSSMACNELASRKRKASEDEGETKKEKKKFSFGTLFDRAKRLWPSHPDDEEEDERQQQV